MLQQQHLQQQQTENNSNNTFNQQQQQNSMRFSQNFSAQQSVTTMDNRGMVASSNVQYSASSQQVIGQNSLDSVFDSPRSPNADLNFINEYIDGAARD